MRYLVRGDFATLEVAGRGAEMKSIRSHGGTEYLWQADPAIWGETSPILFPYVGRLWGGKYRYEGVPYPLPQHGFASGSEFSLVEEGEGRLTLGLFSDEKTRGYYPFEFAFLVTFLWEGATLRTVYRVENRGEKRMFFGLGAHPGFRVPFVEGERFEDYELVFDTPARPCRVGFTPEVFISDKDEPYPLKDDVSIPLRHELFDEDAIILKNMARRVTLRSRISGASITVSYPEMPYLGLWHWPKTQAEYLCIEPWCSLPSRHGVEEEISCKSDLLSLDVGAALEREFTISFGA